VIVLTRRRTRRASKDTQLVLFDKYDEETARRIEERRIRRLVKIRCDRLSERQEAELDRYFAARRAEVQKRWSPAVEAKRRGVNPLHTKCFRDSQDRYMPVLVCWPISTSEEREEYEE
jgi:hypothetical protein